MDLWIIKCFHTATATTIHLLEMHTNINIYKNIMQKELSRFIALLNYLVFILYF